MEELLTSPTDECNGTGPEADPRFGGVARLYSAAALRSFRRAHVCVVGLGGVGCWTAEALARSGVGRLTLVDMDDLCVTNANRQLHAVEGAYGRLKAEAMRERVLSISPNCRVRACAAFFTEATEATIFQAKFDGVVDAIDNVNNKSRLALACWRRRIPFVTAGAAGGRKDATRVRWSALARATHDPLLRRVRKALRRLEPACLAETSDWRAEAVFSSEPAAYPDQAGRARSATRGAMKIDCDTGYGSAAHVTGAFGFAAAGRCLESLSPEGAEEA